MRPCPHHLASLCRTSLDSRVPDSWVPSSSPEFLIPGSPAASCDSGRLLWCEGLTYSLEIGHLGTVPPLSLQGPALILVGWSDWLDRLLVGELGNPGAGVHLGRRAPKTVRGLPESRHVTLLSWCKAQMCSLRACLYGWSKAARKRKTFSAACAAQGCCSFRVKGIGGWDWTHH